VFVNGRHFQNGFKFAGKARTYPGVASYRVLSELFFCCGYLSH
jgi:hypothetical protein